MAEKLFLNVLIEGLAKPLQSIRRLNIAQSIFNHHTFELVVPSESIDPEIDGVFNKVKDLIGKDITIAWETGSFKEGSDGTDAASFLGVVSDVSISGDHSKHMLVVIKGHSPTILLDGVLNTDTYSQCKPIDIYKRASSSNLVSKIKMKDNLSFKDKLPFVVQYNETDFNFLSRVMHRCGEWFYYDGEELSLGLKTQKAIEIKKDRIFSLDYSFNVASPITQIRGRDYMVNEHSDLKGSAAKNKDAIASSVAGESSNLFPAHKGNYMTFPTFADGKEKDQYNKQMIKDDLTRSGQGKSNEVYTVFGVTDMAQLELGSTIKLEGMAYGGEFVITDLTHTCSGKDNYQNHFKAVPSDCGIPPGITVESPQMDDCVAIVTDNSDPEKMGRIKVTFDWGVDESPWLRMLMPHTGKERGFYFVPEVDEEVMVGFEMGQADFPYVIGSLYNGKNKYDAHFDPDNKIKAIKTLSGNEIIFDDTEDGTLTIRNGKNSIELNCDSDGTITIATKGDMVIEAKKNMSISCKEDLTMKVGGDYKLDVKGAHKAKVTGAYSMKATGKVEVGTNADMKLTATKNIDAQATVNLTLKGAMAKVDGSATAELSGGGMTTIKGGLVKIN